MARTGANEFEEMQIEMASLRGVARGPSDVVHGRERDATSKSTDGPLMPPPAKWCHFYLCPTPYSHA